MWKNTYKVTFIYESLNQACTPFDNLLTNYCDIIQIYLYLLNAMNLSVIDFPPAINAEHVDGKYVK